MAVERRVEEASSLRAFFQEQWQHLSQLLGKKETGIRDQHDLGTAVDMVVTGTDARVRAVGGYKNQLREVTRSLLEHIDSIVDDLPPPLKLSRHNMVYEPQMSAFFTSVDQIESVCRHSHELMDYVVTAPKGVTDTLYALLLMQYSEKDMFGSELKGDIVQRDVKQTHAIFSGHHFLSPANSEENLRKGLKYILFENVIKHLKTDLALKRKQDTVSSTVAVSNFSFETLNNPSKYLSTLVELLRLPMQLVTLSNRTVRIDRMGLKVPDTAEKNANEIHFHHLEVGNRYSYLIALTELPWNRVL